MSDQQKIGYIENGIVIDHLPAASVWKIVKILRVDEISLGRVSLGDNYSSTKLGKKSFIKIEGRNILDREINLVALVAPEATISVIENGKVISKRTALIPPLIEGILLCANVNCISNDEKEKIHSKIYYSNGEFKCHFCGSCFGKKEIRIKD